MKAAVCLVGLCLLAGIVTADFSREPRNQYRYNMRSRALDGITQVDSQQTNQVKGRVLPSHSDRQQQRHRQQPSSSSYSSTEESRRSQKSSLPRQQQQQNGLRHQTYYLQNPNDQQQTCFSLRPVPVCTYGYEMKDVSDRMVQFTCSKFQDPQAIQQILSFRIPIPQQCVQQGQRLQQQQEDGIQYQQRAIKNPQSQEQICVSAEKVAKCANGYRVKSLTQQSVKFHCTESKEEADAAVLEMQLGHFVDWSSKEEKYFRIPVARLCVSA